MDERDRELRNRIYAQLVELGRVPTIEETGVGEESLWRLHDEHALVLERDGSAIRMLNPFSAALPRRGGRALVVRQLRLGRLRDPGRPRRRRARLGDVPRLR